MASQVSRRHHFVPEALLRPWLVTHNGQSVLQGYNWDPYRRTLSCKRRGLEAFCNQIDLLTLKAHPQGVDAIERSFFAKIDDEGTKARDKLIEGGPKPLNAEERQAFAMLLLSLEARRPTTVAKLRNEGTSFLISELDKDEELRSVFLASGINQSPSSWYENVVGGSLEDRSLTLVQRLTDNHRVGVRLINAHWDLIRFAQDDAPLVLADRPLIRANGYDDPSAVWLLPLTPKVAFIAVNHPGVLANFSRQPTHRLARYVNVASAQQAERLSFPPRHLMSIGSLNISKVRSQEHRALKGQRVTTSPLFDIWVS